MPNVQVAGDVGLVFTNPAIQIIPLPRSNWWLADGAIPSANVLEHVESPAFGQDYTGAAVAASSPWSLAFKSTGINSATGNGYAFDVQTGRFVIGVSTNTAYGLFIASWLNIALFNDTNVHVWFVVASGSAIQPYLDNVAVGSPITSTMALGTVAKWRSTYNNIAANKWVNPIPKGSIYNAALTSTQRDALYASMLN